MSGLSQDGALRPPCRILLLGKRGQVGWELQRSLAPLGELVALASDDTTLCGDLTDPEGLRDTLARVRPDVIVNAAAYTAVDRAESEPELAARVNAQAPGVLAREAARTGALLVHYSTDYVFDGSGDQPRGEDAPTGPLNVYGRTKLEGEQAIAAAGARHLVFRTSWVYAARGGNFARTMLRLAQERERLTVIADQIGAPTGAELIADVTAHAIRQALQTAAPPGDPLWGVYHLVADGQVSWFDYAKYVLAIAARSSVATKIVVKDVLAIASADYPVAARRPLNSRLATDRLRQRFQLVLPPWQQGVDRLLAEIL